MAQLFFFEFCKISKNTFSYRVSLEYLCFPVRNWQKLLNFGSLTNLVFAFYQSNVFIDSSNIFVNENEKDGLIVSRKS